MGWFYGFKLHLIIKERYEIIQWQLVSGNTDGRENLKGCRFTERFFGKIFTDKGYISQDLFERFFVDGVHLVTKVKKNMTYSLMSLYHKILLRKRSIIETVNDELENIAQVERSRHRCFDNIVVYILGALAAYCCFLKKPCINVQRTLDTRLSLF